MTASHTAPNWRYLLSDVCFDDAEEQAVVQVIRSKWLSMGPKTAEFERRFAEYIGTRHALATANCTVALHLALIAAGVGHGDEVVVPSLTFVATANAVLYLGATPVFADIVSLERPLLDPEDVERKLSAKTRAVVAVHYAGYPCDMDRLGALARARGIRLIEDDAHAIGSRLAGKACGALGDIGCFSFFGNKNLPTGEGGMLSTDDDELAQRMRLLRSHGMTSLSWDRLKGHAFSYDVTELGYNYRMPELSAAVGLVQLDKLRKHNAVRDELFEAYRQRLAGISELVQPFSTEPSPGARHLLPILLPRGVERIVFMQRLRDAGIQSSIHYPPVHQFSHYQKLAAAHPVTLPNSEEYSRRVVTLPFHPGLSVADVGVIVERVAQALAG